MIDSNLLHRFEISEEDVANTPPRVLSLVAALVEEAVVLKKRIGEFEAGLNRNSSDSSQPPSSDKPFKKKSFREKTGKAEGKKGHKGCQQVLPELAVSNPNPHSTFLRMPSGAISKAKNLISHGSHRHGQSFSLNYPVIVYSFAFCTRGFFGTGLPERCPVGVTPTKPAA